MVRRVLSRWWLAAALVTAACDLNPRPEDPGAHGLNTSSPNAGAGNDKTGTGTGGSASTAPPPLIGGAGAPGAPSEGVTTPRLDGGARTPSRSASDASADAGQDGGDAGASTHDDAL